MTKEAIEFLKDTLVTVGVSPVVIGDLPSQEMDCVAIRPVDGYPSTRFFGTENMDEPLVEVLVRTETYQEGQRIYDLVKKTLDKLVAEAQGILSVLLTGSPGYLGANEKGFKEWHMIFHVTLIT